MNLWYQGCSYLLLSIIIISQNNVKRHLFDWFCNNLIIVILIMALTRAYLHIIKFMHSYSVLACMCIITCHINIKVSLFF